MSQKSIGGRRIRNALLNEYSSRYIDEDDTPFLALGLELKAKLWTGDKVLTRGLNKKQVDLIITTKELQSNNDVADQQFFTMLVG